MTLASLRLGEVWRSQTRLSFVRALAVTAISFILGCDQPRNSVDAEDIKLFRQTADALLQLSQDMPSTDAVASATNAALLTILSQDLLLLEQGPRGDSVLRKSQNDYLRAIIATLESADLDSEPDLRDSLRKLIADGASLVADAGMPWITDVTYTVNPVTGEPVHISIVGHQLTAQRGEIFINGRTCDVQAKASNKLSVSCDSDAWSTLPKSAVNGKWTRASISMQMLATEVSWLDRIIASDKHLAQISLIVTLLPVYSGSLTVVELGLSEKANTREMRRVFSATSGSCASRDHAWQVAPETNEGWSIDPSSVRVSHVSSSALSRPQLRDVGPGGFTVRARAEGARCIKSPFGNTRIGPGGFVRIEVSWSEVRGGISPASDVARDLLVKWSEVKTFALSEKAAGVLVEFKRSDGIVERLEFDELSPSNKKGDWLTGTIAQDASGKALRVETLSAEEIQKLSAAR